MCALVGFSNSGACTEGAHRISKMTTATEIGPSAARARTRFGPPFRTTTRTLCCIICLDLGHSQTALFARAAARYWRGTVNCATALPRLRCGAARFENDRQSFVCGDACVCACVCLFFSPSHRFTQLHHMHHICVYVWTCIRVDYHTSTSL